MSVVCVYLCSSWKFHPVVAYDGNSRIVLARGVRKGEVGAHFVTVFPRILSKPRITRTNCELETARAVILSLQHWPEQAFSVATVQCIGSSRDHHYVGLLWIVSENLAILF